MILVADDFDFVRKAITDCLRAYGYQVVSVSTVAEAIADLTRGGQAIKFLITDLDFQGHGIGSEGFDIARYALKVGELQPSQVVILTGLPPEKLPDDLRGCILMAKPVKMSKIIEMIKAAGIEPAAR